MLCNLQQSFPTVQSSVYLSHVIRDVIAVGGNSGARTWDTSAIASNTVFSARIHWCIDIISCTAARMFNKLTYLLNYSLAGNSHTIQSHSSATACCRQPTCRLYHHRQRTW